MSLRKSKSDVFCHCRGPEDGFMIECELCQEWFHGTCVGVRTQIAKKLIHWYCSVCMRVNNVVTKLMENVSEDVKRSMEEVNALKVEITNLKKKSCSDELSQEKSDLLKKICAFKEEILGLKNTIRCRDEELATTKEIFGQEKCDLLKNVHDLQQELRDVKAGDDHALKQEVVSLMEKIACCDKERSSAQEAFRKEKCNLMDNVQNLQQQLKEEKKKSHQLDSELKDLKRRKLSLKQRSQET